MDTMRWVAVSPKDQRETLLSLVKAEPQDEHLVGKQSGNHVFITLLTDDVERDYQELKSRGSTLCYGPKPNLGEWKRSLKIFMATALTS